MNRFFLPVSNNQIRPKSISHKAVISLWAQIMILVAGMSLASQSAMALSNRHGASISTSNSTGNSFKADGSGVLMALTSHGKTLGLCPLKHTNVSATISGYVARVNVTQTFANPFQDKIEAIYTFPPF